MSQRRAFAWVSAAPARTITAPTGVDQVSDSPRIATPAAVAITGMKYVTIWAVVGPTSATMPETSGKAGAPANTEEDVK